MHLWCVLTYTYSIYTVVIINTLVVFGVWVLEVWTFGVWVLEIWMFGVWVLEVWTFGVWVLEVWMFGVWVLVYVGIWRRGVWGMGVFRTICRHVGIWGGLSRLRARDCTHGVQYLGLSYHALETENKAG